jgi:hypothetical protein
VTNRTGSVKVIAGPEGLALCGVVPDIQGHVYRFFDRAYRITISDNLVAESLPSVSLQITHDSSAEGLDLSCHPCRYEF